MVTRINCFLGNGFTEFNCIARYSQAYQHMTFGLCYENRKLNRVQQTSTILQCSSIYLYILYTIRVLYPCIQPRSGWKDAEYGHWVGGEVEPSHVVMVSALHCKLKPSFALCVSPGHPIVCPFHSDFTSSAFIWCRTNEQINWVEKWLILRCNMVKVFSWNKTSKQIWFTENCAQNKAMIRRIRPGIQALFVPFKQMEQNKTTIYTCFLQQNNRNRKHHLVCCFVRLKWWTTWDNNGFVNTTGKCCDRRTVWSLHNDKFGSLGFSNELMLQKLRSDRKSSGVTSIGDIN